MSNAYLIGERVRLRPIEHADLIRLQQLLSDPDISLLYGDGGIGPSLRELERRYDAGDFDLTDRSVQLGVETGSVLIGMLGLKAGDLISDRSGTFNCLIGDRAYLHKGYGLEACQLFLDFVFAILGYHKVNLEVYEYNIAAIGLYEKLGFAHEGVRRENNWSRGAFWSDILMGITADEWRNVRGDPPAPNIE